LFFSVQSGNAPPGISTPAGAEACADEIYHGMGMRNNDFREGESMRTRYAAACFQPPM